MLISIIRYLKGYLRIRIIGYSPERFLNLCSHNNIYLWGLEPRGNAYELYITVRGFRKLKPIIKKTKTRVTITDRFGLPFFLHKYRKRKMFFGGLFICIAIIYVMSLFVWDVDISGNLVRTDETILEFLETKEVKHGMRKSRLDCERIVKDIRKEFDDIIWVSASIQGTRLIVQIKENTDKIYTAEDQEETAAPTDIVAAKDGVISSIITRSGVPQVHEGDTVKAGDVLVKGNVEVKNDAGDIVDYKQRVSDADIYARTEYRYEEELPLTYYRKQYTGNNKSQFYLRVNNSYINFGLLKHNYKDWQISSAERRLKIGNNFYLPLSYGKKVLQEYSLHAEIYSEMEYKSILTDNFERFCRQLEKKGVVIIENNVRIYKGKNKASAKGTVTVTELIGTPVKADEITIEDQEGNTDGDSGNVD